MTKEVYVCRNCKYFAQCGDKNRTAPCNGKVVANGGSKKK